MYCVLCIPIDIRCYRMWIPWRRWWSNREGRYDTSIGRRDHVPGNTSDVK